MTTTGTRKVKSETPWELYAIALDERKSTDEIDRRQACEKSWLAMVKAVDLYLSSNGYHVQVVTADAHVQRKEFLNKLAAKDMTARRVSNLMSEITENLHGTCFYAGKDSPHIDIILNEDVKEILELSGCD